MKINNIKNIIMKRYNFYLDKEETEKFQENCNSLGKDLINKTLRELIKEFNRKFKRMKDDNKN